ncbi:unnamed protein product [Mytilus coruscus]|uniref:Uncharacterized protein n=1 Tax=Mytilus coruscus TaxID=42192 RepID=A0A6J8BWZ5_MYTCO|nr:unnamed protein product [Mytilus coruscus]
MIKRLLVHIFYCCIWITFCTSNNSKRLLLNDPDVTNNRLNWLEGIVSKLNASLQQVTSQHQRQEQEIQRQNQEIQQQRLTIQKQDKTVEQLSSNIQRWAGGSFYDQPGAAAEYVCLPPDPDFVKTTAGEYGRMYGAEFDTNLFASDANNEDFPCAFCRPKYSSSSIMIPGKKYLLFWLENGISQIPCIWISCT